MKGFSGWHLNEFVGLTILILMAIAVIAGQAEATMREMAPGAAAGGQPKLHATLGAVVDAAAVRADVAIAFDIGGIAAFLRGDTEDGTRIEIRTGRSR